MIARALCRAGRELHALGLLAGRAGNLSVRLPGGAGLLVTPRGRHKGRLRTRDLVRVDLSDPERSSVDRATSELLVHLEAYRAEKQVGAVVHVHGPALTAAGLREIDLSDRLPELGKAVGGTALVPFAPSGSEELARAVGRSIRSGAHLLLLQRHGAVALAAGLEEALHRVELAELSAYAILLAESTGMELNLERVLTLHRRNAERATR